MTEIERAIEWLKDNSYNLAGKELHYSLILFYSIDSLRQENKQLREVINKIKKICDSVPVTWSICGIDVVNKIEKVLKEVDK